MEDRCSDGHGSIPIRRWQVVACGLSHAPVLDTGGEGVGDRTHHPLREDRVSSKAADYKRRDGALITSEPSLAVVVVVVVVVACTVARIPSVEFPHDGETADDLYCSLPLLGSNEWHRRVDAGAIVEARLAPRQLVRHTLKLLVTRCLNDFLTIHHDNGLLNRVCLASDNTPSPGQPVGLQRPPVWNLARTQNRSGLPRILHWLAAASRETEVK